MSLPRSTTQLVLPDAYISSIELGKLPPPPDANFAVLIYPLCVVGAAVCAAAYAMCTSSTGAKITCPAPDFTRVWRYGSSSWCMAKYTGALANNAAQYALGNIDTATLESRNARDFTEFLLCMAGVGKGGLNAGTG